MHRTTTLRPDDSGNIPAPFAALYALIFFSAVYGGGLGLLYVGQTFTTEPHETIAALAGVAGVGFGARRTYRHPVDLFAGVDRPTIDELDSRTLTLAEASDTLGATVDEVMNNMTLTRGEVEDACIAAGIDPVMSWRRVPIVPESALALIGRRIRAERAELEAMDI